VGPDTIRRAAAVHPIVDLQIEYALISRSPEAQIFPVLEELGIAATTYGTLSRGLLAGSQPASAGDFRLHLPRFTGANLTANQRLVEKLNETAAARGITSTQLAIAWALNKRSFVIPVIGARKRTQLSESLAALEIRLSEEEISALETAVPADAVAGTRYDSKGMRSLDSEK
jgi:aryl-alcohol dehydrogenase-like predicted oxidoreductase